MKKLLAILLMLVMLLSMAACSSDSTSDDDDDDDDEISDSNKDNSEENEDKENEDKENEDEKINLKALQDITFEPVTVVDNDDCKIELTSLEYDELFGYTFGVTVANKTEETLTFSLESTSGNGVQISDAFFYEEVAAGETAEDTIQFIDEEMGRFGGAMLTKIDFIFTVSNSDYDELLRETVTVNPYGTDKSTADFVREPQEGDQVLVDNEYVSVTVYECTTDELLDCYVMKCYVVNKTDAAMWFEIEDISLNGIEVSGLGIEKIQPGCSWFGGMEVWETELEEHDIETVEQIDFTLNAYTFDDRYEDNDEFVDEEYTVKP